MVNYELFIWEFIVIFNIKEIGIFVLNLLKWFIIVVYKCYFEWVYGFGYIFWVFFNVFVNV